MLLFQGFLKFIFLVIIRNAGLKLKSRDQDLHALQTEPPKHPQSIFKYISFATMASKFFVFLKTALLRYNAHTITFTF